MTIPLDRAADGFQRFFPEEWRDYLNAWLASQQSRGMLSDVPPPPPACITAWVRTEMT